MGSISAEYISYSCPSTAAAISSGELLGIGRPDGLVNSQSAIFVQLSKDPSGFGSLLPHSSKSRGLPAVYSKSSSATVPRCQNLKRLNLTCCFISNVTWVGIGVPLSVRKYDPAPDRLLFNKKVNTALFQWFGSLGIFIAVNKVRSSSTSYIGVNSVFNMSDLLPHRSFTNILKDCSLDSKPLTFKTSVFLFV